MLKDHRNKALGGPQPVVVLMRVDNSTSYEQRALIKVA